MAFSGIGRKSNIVIAPIAISLGYGQFTCFAVIAMKSLAELKS